MGSNSLKWYPVEGGKLIFIGYTYAYEGGVTGITVPASEAEDMANGILAAVKEYRRVKWAYGSGPDTLDG